MAKNGRCYLHTQKRKLNGFYLQFTPALMVICYICKEDAAKLAFCYTPFQTVSLLSLVRMTILYTLMEFGVVRFNEIKRYAGEGESNKGLAVGNTIY